MNDKLKQRLLSIDGNNYDILLTACFCIAEGISLDIICNSYQDYALKALYNSNIIYKNSEDKLCLAIDFYGETKQDITKDGLSILINDLAELGITNLRLSKMCGYNVIRNSAEAAKKYNKLVKTYPHDQIVNTCYEYYTNVINHNGKPKTLMNYLLHDIELNIDEYEQRESRII